MTSKLLGQAIGLSGTTGNSTNITLSSNGSLQLAANGGTDIFISANDNIGFGNTTPVDKLSIQGSLYTSSNTVTIGTAAYFVNNGNIGIGVTPSTKLHVYGSSDPIIRCESSSPGQAGQFTAVGNGASSYPGFNLQQDSTGYWSMQLRADTNLYLYRQSGNGNVLIPFGNIGIGTSSPGYLIDIQNTSTSVDYIAGRFFSQAAGTGESRTWVRIDKGNAYGGAVGAYLDQGIGSGLILGTTNNNNTPTEQVRITHTGSVGIGTSTPVAKLSLLSTGSGVSVNFNANGLPQSATRGGLINYWNDGSIYYNDFWNWESNGIFRVGTAGSERLRVTSDGNVGIGTGSPSKRVEIGDTNNSTSLTTGLMISNYSSTTDSRAGIVFKSFDNIGCSIWSRRTGSFAGDLCFGTKPESSGSITENGITERVRIDSFGNFCIGTTSATARFTLSGVAHFGTTSSGARVNINHNVNDYLLFVDAYTTGQAASMQVNRCGRNATSAYYFLLFESGAMGLGTYDVEMYVRGDGQAYIDGSWNGGGADYAEYFEWLDGNPNNEDRRGYTVSLVGNKIKIAEQGETVIGVISATPVVIGDVADVRWSNKYLKDDFGSYIMEPIDRWEWKDENGEDKSCYSDNVPEGWIVPENKTVIPDTRRKLNPAWNADEEYISREKRPEWSPVGLVGKLRIRKNQIIPSNWIKMRDISNTVEEWLVK